MISYVLLCHYNFQRWYVRDDVIKHNMYKSFKHDLCPDYFYLSHTRLLSTKTKSPMIPCFFRISYNLVFSSRRAEKKQLWKGKKLPGEKVLEKSFWRCLWFTLICLRLVYPDPSCLNLINPTNKGNHISLQLSKLQLEVKKILKSTLCRNWHDVWVLHSWQEVPRVHPTRFGECWVNRSCNTQAFFSHRAVICTSLLCFWRDRQDWNIITFRQNT